MLLGCFQFINLKLIKTLVYRFNHLDLLKINGVLIKRAPCDHTAITIAFILTFAHILHVALFSDKRDHMVEPCIKFCPQHPERK